MKSLLKKLAILWTVVCLTNAGTFGKSIAVNVFAEEPEQSAEPTKSAETAEEVQEEKKDDALEAEPSADTEIDQYEVSEKNADPKETAVPEESAVPEKKIISGSPEPSQESSATAESAEPFSSPEPVAEESLEAETESFEVDSLTVSATSYVNGIPSDAFQYNGHYYFVFNALTGIPNLSSYSKMEEYCENLGGHLATITSEGENTFIYQMIKNHFSGKDAYIGYSDYENNGTWKWVTGTSSLYENFAAGQPAGYYNHHIAQYYNDGRGLWKEASFDKNHAFVCEWDGLDDAEPWKEEPVQEPAISIPSDAYQYGGHYYYVFNALKGVSSLTGYSKMEEYCEKRGGHLATVTSPGEDSFIFKMIKNHFGGKDAYFGYSDTVKSGIWRWITGETSVYSNFSAGQPAGYYNNHIAQYYNDGRGQWEEASFDKNHAFVCEWDHLDGQIAMYRLYNPNSGEHFYTGSTGELCNLTYAGWNLEGVGWLAPSDSGAPVYRLYNPNAGDHHYTMSVEERDTLVRLGWQYEGVAWNSADSSQLPLYRLYNPNALLAGAHHYTLSAEERDHLTSLGWRYEGIAWYGLTQ